MKEIAFEELEPQDDPPASAAGDEPAPLEVVRFDITSLFMLTFFCALGIALVRRFDLLATVALFILCVIVSILLYRNRTLPTRRFWLQAVWGVLFPLCCLFTDPILFRGGFAGGSMAPSRMAIASYTFIGWQMAVLCATWLLQPTHGRWASFLAGNLVAGALFAGVIGLVLALPTLFFSIVLIGLPGLTPWFTMAVYLNAFQVCRRIGERNVNPNVSFALSAAGLATAFGVGVAAVFVSQVLLRQ